MNSYYFGSCRSGVGDGETRNRYCVIGFGGFGSNLRPGHFRSVAGQACYTAAEFPLAQRQLVAAGLFEDGYQAIKFGLDNVPFRESPFIAKNVILVTDEGRTPIREGADITRASIEAELKVCVESSPLVTSVYTYTSCSLSVASQIRGLYVEL